MNLQMRKSEEQISKEELGLVIDKYKLNLPDSYIEFILKHNGGYNSPSNYEEGVNIDYFYCVKLNREVDIFSKQLTNAVEMIEDYQIKEEELPKGLFPFAADAGGNTYCMSMNEADYGTIYKFYWDGSPKAFISHSFRELISGLR